MFVAVMLFHDAIHEGWWEAAIVGDDEADGVGRHEVKMRLMHEFAFPILPARQQA